MDENNNSNPAPVVPETDTASATPETNPAAPETETASATPEPNLTAPESTPVTSEANIMTNEPATPSMPTSSPVAQTSSATLDTTKKPVNKKKIAIIVGISAVVLAGAGFGIAYAISNQPEAIALSIFSNIVNAKNINVDGTFSIKLNNKYTDKFEQVKLTLNSNTNGVSSSSENAELTVVYDGKEISVSLGAITVEDKTIYIKLDNLNDAYTKIMAIVSDSGYESYVTPYEDFISGIIGEIDGQWYKINADDLIDSIDSSTSKQKEQEKAMYSCAMEVMDSEYAKMPKYTDIYSKHRFLKLNKTDSANAQNIKSDGTVYEVKLDKDNFVGFYNEAIKIVDVDSMKNCLDKTGKFSASELKSFDGTKIEEMKADDIKTDSDNKSDSEMLVATSGIFNHKLTGLYFGTNTNDSSSSVEKIELTAHVNYDKKDISAPTNTKDIDELVKTINEKVEALSTSLSSNCLYNSTKCASVTQYYNEY